MFKILPFSIAAAICSIAAPAAAQSPFDGTWKADLAAAKIDAKPNEFKIVDGTYSCASCLPAPYSVRADGQFHAVMDRPYWDEIAVTVVDPRTVGYQFRKDGKVIARNVQTLTADGSTLTYKNMNTNNGAGAPIENVGQWTRIGAAPAGEHAISGQWRSAPSTSASDAALTFVIKVDGNRLSMKSPGMGESLDAAFGGPFALNAGDPGKTMTKAERLSPTSIRLTDMQLGKVTQIATYTVAADGATMTGDWQDPRDGSKGTFIARRQ